MTAAGFDAEVARKDFPILSRMIGDHPLVYLDSAATSQKPTAVLEVMDDYYRRYNANVHRGIHRMAEEATAAYEGARDTVAAFIGAEPEQVVFTKNSTEAINLVAYGFLTSSLGRGSANRFTLGAGDEIVVTEMEHHSNLVPWQMLAERTGATLRWIGITDEGRLDLDQIYTRITERTKLVAFVHQSNILGTINPVDAIVARAREVGALTLLDASQSVPHMPVDIGALGVDFMAFTGHKMCGPTGIGVLVARPGLLAELPPFLGGGEMISVVTMEKSTYAEVPHKFEAGTPPIVEAIGLGAAIRYLTEKDLDAIHAHERTVVDYAISELTAIPGVRIIGPASSIGRGAALSFVVGDVHPHDVGQILDADGVAVRVGHHCARPTCLRFGVPATTRASFYLYNTKEDVDALVRGIGRVKKLFGV